MRVLGRVLKWIGIFLLVLVVAGAIYQQIGTMIDAKAAPPPGQLVAIDGRQVHVLCVGAGKRTFVLDAGLGGWSVDWYRIQPALAKLGRVCAYDRPGSGWSDAGGNAFDGTAAASELSKVVGAAKIPTPFVYVGHSLGANFAQIYAAEHPSEVEALVLLEPGNPKDLLEDFHGTREQAMNLPECDAMCFVGWVVGYLGVGRATSHLSGAKSFKGDDLALAQYRAGISRSSVLGSAGAYFGALPKTAYECRDVQTFGATPVLMLASSQLRKPEGKETAEDVIRWHAGYLQYLASVAAKSSHGKGPVVIPDSTHSSMLLQEKPAAAVVSAIETFLGKGATQPSLNL